MKSATLRELVTAVQQPLAPAAPQHHDDVILLDESGDPRYELMRRVRQVRDAADCAC